MIFLFPRWDMLISWRVSLSLIQLIILLQSVFFRRLKMPMKVSWRTGRSVLANGKQILLSCRILRNLSKTQAIRNTFWEFPTLFLENSMKPVCISQHWRPGLCHWPTFWERQPETAHSKRRGFGALFGDKCNKDDRWALGLDNWIRFNCWRIWRRCLNSHYWFGQGYMTLDLNAAKIFANAQGFRSL